MNNVIDVYHKEEYLSLKMNSHYTLSRHVKNNSELFVIWDKKYPKDFEIQSDLKYLSLAAIKQSQNHNPGREKDWNQG